MRRLALSLALLPRQRRPRAQDLYRHDNWAALWPRTGAASRGRRHPDRDRPRKLHGGEAAQTGTRRESRVGGEISAGTALNESAAARPARQFRRRRPDQPLGPDGRADQRARRGGLSQWRPRHLRRAGAQHRRRADQHPHPRPHPAGGHLERATPSCPAGSPTRRSTMTAAASPAAAPGPACSSASSASWGSCDARGFCFSPCCCSLARRGLRQRGAGARPRPVPRPARQCAGRLRHRHRPGRLGRFPAQRGHPPGAAQRARPARREHPSRAAAKPQRRRRHRHRDACPPAANVGDRIDVTVSSIGDARSLAGGTLLMTPLLGPDQRALCAGAGLAGGRRPPLRQPAQFAISATIRPPAPSPAAPPSRRRCAQAWSARAASWSSCCAIPISAPPSGSPTASIRRSGAGAARVARRRQRRHRRQWRGDVNGLIARIENVTVDAGPAGPDRDQRAARGRSSPARRVQISSVVISQGDIRVSVTAENEASQPQFYARLRRTACRAWSSPTPGSTSSSRATRSCACPTPASAISSRRCRGHGSIRAGMIADPAGDARRRRAPCRNHRSIGGKEVAEITSEPDRQGAGRAHRPPGRRPPRTSPMPDRPGFRPAACQLRAGARRGAAGRGEGAIRAVQPADRRARRPASRCASTSSSPPPRRPPCATPRSPRLLNRQMQHRSHRHHGEPVT